MDVPPPPVLPRTRRSVSFWVAALALCAGLGWAGYEAYYVVFGKNLHTVVPGQIYRSAQLTPEALRATIDKLGIRTVINLRGHCPDFDWYRRETDLLTQLGVRQQDVNFSSVILPAAPELRKLVHTLDSCEYPVLLHCRRGADRTGLAAGVALLLRGNAGLDEAKAQLSWRYGHLPLGRACELQMVLDMYEHWLRRQGKLHQPELFRRWVMEDYKPGPCWAEIVPLEVPTRLKRFKPAAARFRVYNRSDYPWRLTPDAHVGFHLRFLLHNEDRSYAVTGGAGYFDAVVQPGEAIDLTLSLPAIDTHGPYRLLVDMADEQRCWFFLAGSKPFEAELQVGD